jgi:hypothetical protein
MRAICRRGLLAACFVLMSASFVRADSKPDLSSPKKAAAAFALALQAGDLDTVKASSIGDADDYKLMQSVTSAMAAVHQLHQAAVTKFGAEEAKKLATGETDNANVAQQVEASDEKVDADSATILEKGKPESNTVHLKRVNGDWRVDLTDFPQKQEMRQIVPMLDAMRIVMAQSAADVLAGHYKNVDEAALSVRQRRDTLMAAVAKQQIPQTRPAK